MKKIISIFLALAMCISLSVPAFAYEVGPADCVTPNTERSVLATANGTGTESNPYILTEGQAYATSATAASNTWFKTPAIAGAVDFTVKTSVSATVTMYKKTLLGKTQIGTASGASINKTIGINGTMNDSNYYLINVQVSSGMTSSITVQQHVDKTSTYYANSGTMWKSNSSSPLPLIGVVTESRWYLKVNDVDKLSSFINHDGYYDLCNDFAKGLISIGGVAKAVFGDTKYEKLIGAALALIGLMTPTDFRDQVLENLDVAGGWNGKTYTKNVYMKQVWETNYGLRFAYMYTWDGGAMTGEPGYLGSFGPGPN